MKQITIFLLAWSFVWNSEAAPTHEVRGVQILSEILSEKWAEPLKGISLGRTKLIKEKVDLEIKYNLPPVWYAPIEQEGKPIGHLMWDRTGEGKIVEFSIDAKLTFQSKSAVAIAGVPPFQQFALPAGEEKLIASGCVPTAGASLVSHWANHKLPKWAGEKEDLAAITKRLRSRLKMSSFPDHDGFTENGMALAGATPVSLARALREDAAARSIAVDCKYQRFTFLALKNEIKASRPALVSCRVRVPHKPQLSWGHEIIAVGWALLDDSELVGVLDNFFPTRNPETIRWIRKDAFNSIITVKPSEKEER